MGTVVVFNWYKIAVKSGHCRSHHLLVQRSTGERELDLGHPSGSGGAGVEEAQCHSGWTRCEGMSTDVVGSGLAIVTWTPGLTPLLPAASDATLCSV